jgi:catalase
MARVWLKGEEQRGSRRIGAWRHSPPGIHMAKSSKRSSGKSATVHDQKLNRGEGGELHQIATGDTPVLTTAQGGPVSDDQNSLKIGPRGPTLLEDFHFREKIFHFDHERIPERVVHARGYGAHGFFENYKPLSKYTRADLFQRAGERTEAFVRFSTVAGSKGSADLARDVRGFAVKLYTQEGNWDIVGNNIPVFFIQDAIKFPDIIHAVKEEPDSAFPQAQSAHDNFWDFISLTPESMHMIMWVMSDRAILPLHGRFWRAYLPSRQRQGRIHLRKISLETKTRPAVGAVERGTEDQRR